MAKKNINDLRKDAYKDINAAKQNLSLLEEESKKLINILDIKRRIAIQNDIKAQKQKIANALEDAYNKAKKDGYDIDKKTIDALNKEIISNEESIKQIDKKINHQKQFNKILSSTSNVLKNIWGITQNYDTVIKSSILNLGMSGVKADMLRSSFEASAGYVARIGGNIRDINVMMLKFANVTGRARALSGEMVNDIEAMSKGTGLGVRTMSDLAAKWEYLGVSVNNTFTIAQGIVETSELMGVNMQNVFSKVANQFNKLQTYNFKFGVQGMANMAMYGEKFAVSIDQTMNAADKARTLKGAIEMAASLQVMGGEFAKSDPFKMLYLARNDLEGFQKQINEMTKGMVTFRKMSDGTFQKFISPADRDRLRFVAKTLGMSTEEITKQVYRMADLQKMRQQMFGAGYTDNQRKLLEGMAFYDDKMNKFFIRVHGTKKDISDITGSELAYLKTQKSGLKERAKAAQSFDAAFKATIEELKTALLPILRGVNVVLEKVRPIAIKFNEWITHLSETSKSLLKGFGIFLGAGFLFKSLISPLLRIVFGLQGAIRGSSNFGGFLRNVTAPKAQFTNVATQTGTAGTSATGLLTGLGVGAAGLGIGEGLNLAAGGISKIADAMSKLTPEQAKTLQNIVHSLTIMSVIGVAVGATIAIWGGSATAVLPGLLAFGAAMVGVGFGINLATKGIATMVKSFASLKGNGSDIAATMLGISGSVGILSASLASMTLGAGGLLVFSGLLKSIAKRSDDLDKVGTAFANINSVVSASKEQFSEIEKFITNISSANFNNLNKLAELKNIFEKPLKVEFADKQVAVVSDITLKIDSYELLEKTNIGAQLISNYKDAANSKVSLNPAI